MDRFRRIVSISRAGRSGNRLVVDRKQLDCIRKGVQLIPGFKLHIFAGREFIDRLNYPDHPAVKTHVVDGEFVAAGRVGEQFAKDNGMHWEGGFFNLARREGLKLAYLEAYDEMPIEPDHVFQAISSEMGLLGAFKGAHEYRELGRMSKIPSFVAVQQGSCAPMAHAFAEDSEQILPHHIVKDPRGLAYAILRGNPSGTYPYIRAMCLRTGGDILSVSEDIMRKARGLLLETARVNVCFASAAALGGAIVAAEKGLIGKESVVLVNLTGSDRPTGQVPSYIAAWSM